ncbi:hypothetical protein D3C75_1042460 [compost metagenome]
MSAMLWFRGMLSSVILLIIIRLQNKLALAMVTDIVHPFLRIFRINRHIGSTAFQDA